MPSSEKLSENEMLSGFIFYFADFMDSRRASVPDGICMLRIVENKVLYGGDGDECSDSGTAWNLRRTA